jgi:hypothetical protein
MKSKLNIDISDDISFSFPLLSFILSLLQYSDLKFSPVFNMSPHIADEWLSLLLRTWEARGSYLGSEDGYPSRFDVVFISAKLTP